MPNLTRRPSLAAASRAHPSPPRGHTLCPPAAPIRSPASATRLTLNVPGASGGRWGASSKPLCAHQPTKKRRAHRHPAQPLTYTPLPSTTHYHRKTANHRSMGDDWDYDFLPPGLGFTDLADPQQMQEPDQVQCSRVGKCVHQCVYVHCVWNRKHLAMHAPRPFHRLIGPTDSPTTREPHKSIEQQGLRDPWFETAHAELFADWRRASRGRCVNPRVDMLASIYRMCLYDGPPATRTCWRWCLDRSLCHAANLSTIQVTRAADRPTTHPPTHPKPNRTNKPTNRSGSLGGRRLSGKARRCSNQGPNGVGGLLAPGARRGSGGGGKENQGAQQLMGPPRELLVCVDKRCMPSFSTPCTVTVTTTTKTKPHQRPRSPPGSRWGRSAPART